MRCKVFLELDHPPRAQADCSKQLPKSYDTNMRFTVFVPFALPLSAKGWFSKLGSLVRSLFTTVPYYIGDLERAPKIENYPYDVAQAM